MGFQVCQQAELKSQLRKQKAFPGVSSCSLIPKCWILRNINDDKRCTTHHTRHSRCRLRWAPGMSGRGCWQHWCRWTPSWAGSWAGPAPAPRWWPRSGLWCCCCSWHLPLKHSRVRDRDRDSRRGWCLRVLADLKGLGWRKCRRFGNSNEPKSHMGWGYLGWNKFLPANPAVNWVVNFHSLTLL